MCPGLRCTGPMEGCRHCGFGLSSVVPGSNSGTWEVQPEHRRCAQPPMIAQIRVRRAGCDKLQSTRDKGHWGTGGLSSFWPLLKDGWRLFKLQVAHNPRGAVRGQRPRSTETPGPEPGCLLPAPSVAHISTLSVVYLLIRHLPSPPGATLLGAAGDTAVTAWGLLTQPLRVSAAPRGRHRPCAGGRAEAQEEAAQCPEGPGLGQSAASW